VDAARRETICSVDSMIRLINDVSMDNFKANFDTGHFSAQRENVPLALAKLRGMYANLHVSDNDPASTDHLASGDGVIDWSEFFRLLKVQGYDGYLALDLGNRPYIGRGSSPQRRRIAANRGEAGHCAGAMNPFARGGLWL
jgi:sugar phosphate isomerase/epimerase